MIKIDQIQRLHIELTTRCNARCPMCMRNYRGYDFNSGYPLTELDLQHIQKIFQPDFLSQIKKINFNGNLGDFALAKDAIEIVQYFLDNSSANIQIETNGSVRNADWWAQLSDPRIRILFALDGMSDTHCLYRQDTDWQKIIDNASSLISAGGRAVWKFIPFKHNLHQQDACAKLAQKLGFEQFVIYDQGRNQGPVFARTGSFSHWLGNPEHEYIPDVQPLVENHLNWFDQSQPIAWIADENCNLECVHLKDREIYIAADGSVYPCCYLGFFPNTMSHPGNIQVKKIATKNNALEYGLKDAITWFDGVYNSWQKKSIKEGRLYACINACGKS